MSIVSNGIYGTRMFVDLTKVKGECKENCLVKELFVIEFLWIKISKYLWLGLLICSQ